MFLEGGHLFHFNLTGNRRAIGTDDPRLADRVADNLHKWEITESESLLIGRNFGIGTDMHTGPSGNLFVVSLSTARCTRFFGRRGDRARAVSGCQFSVPSDQFKGAMSVVALSELIPDPWSLIPDQSGRRSNPTSRQPSPMRRK